MTVLYAALAVLSIMICRNARVIGHRLRLLDVPNRNGRKKHRRVTPLVGGLVVITPVLFLSLLALASGGGRLYAAALLLAGGSLVLGLFDDRRHIRPVLRLAVAAGIAGGAIMLSPAMTLESLRFDALSLVLPLGAAGWLFSVLCLVGLQNAVNMADGKNGLVIGLSLIWTVQLAVFGPAELLPLLTVLGAGLAVTLIFNLRGRLFLGDAGSYSISMLLGGLAIYSYNSSAVDVSAEMIILLFMVPVLDCLRVMIGRFRRGESLFAADRSHLHHILADAMAWPKALGWYMALVGGPIVVANIAPALTPLCLAGVGLAYGLIVRKTTRRADVAPAATPSLALPTVSKKAAEIPTRRAA